MQTIDRFARSVLHARRSLARDLSLSMTQQYDADCAAAAQLIAHPGVAAWISNSYPIIIADELQDADLGRLGIIQALASSCDLIIAADEFQCLNAALLPSQAVAWMHDACTLTPLGGNHRTKNTSLLRAASLLRSGKNLPNSGLIPVSVPRGPNAHAFSIAQHLDRHPGESVAIITPSATTSFTNAIERLSGKVGKTRRFAPRHVHVERSTDVELTETKTQIVFRDRRDIAGCVAELRRSGNHHLFRLADWLLHKHRVSSLDQVTDDLVEERLSLILHQSRSYGAAKERQLAAMTVHAAKNREFDGVVIFWPYRLGGSDDHRRRLLYNAITRAKSWCCVVLEGDSISNSTPFTTTS